MGDGVVDSNKLPIKPGYTAVEGFRCRKTTARSPSLNKSSSCADLGVVAASGTAQLEIVTYEMKGVST